MGKYSGIDVSKWQGRIDWSLVKNDGVQFAMIRSTFGWGQGSEDFLFKTNYENAKKVDMPVGVYHYSYARTPEEAVKEADFCHSVIKGKKFEYPVAYDMEEAGVASLGKERVSAIAKAFCERMQSYGYYVCIYANKHWLENYFTDEIFDKYDIWLAQWTTRPDFNRVYGMWQKSSKGRVEGISGYVDLNEAYKHYPSIMKNNGLNGYEKTQKKPYKPEKKPVVKVYKAGDALALRNEKLYASATMTTESKNITGEYFVYDGKVINDRIRITNSQGNVNRKPIGNFVTGYINVSDTE
jgi:GH25 family lysozyme M1 (1,4-beta-N-acetylmuramidase)